MQGAERDANNCMKKVRDRHGKERVSPVRTRAVDFSWNGQFCTRCAKRAIILYAVLLEIALDVFFCICSLLLVY